MYLSGWGNYPRIQTCSAYFESVSQLIDIVKHTEDVIVYAMGRSYGDSALSQNVIFSRRFDKILNFDPKKGTLTCESGVTIGDLVSVFLPKGWFLPITPGTKHVSLGGAIAGDVHGKNHHHAGCFGNHVLSFELLLPDGRLVSCNPSQDQELFRATCGGMGLTGIILTVTLQMIPVPSTFMHEKIFTCRNLQDAFLQFEQHQSTAYSVAWVDCLATGRNMGRSILITGDHSDAGPKKFKKSKSLSIPINLPSAGLNSLSLRLFNHLYHRLHSTKAETRPVHLESFFYPLDRIEHWNRIYGKNGLIQYQFVLPKAAGPEGIDLILRKVIESPFKPFLGTLKLLGKQNENYLSFPLEGYTLAFDFKVHPKLFSFLIELDRMVIDYGGRLYLAKDARMSKEVFQKGYPEWTRFADLRKKRGMVFKLRSLQSNRLGV
jgi:FAD/FMN-containing dehydrogenase